MKSAYSLYNYKYLIYIKKIIDNASNCVKAMSKLDEKIVNMKLYPNGKPAEAAQAGMLLTLYLLFIS